MAGERRSRNTPRQGAALLPDHPDGVDMFKEVGANDLAEAFMAMAVAAQKAGPLNDRDKLLVLCGAYVASSQRGGFLYHAQLALKRGIITREELIHAVLINMVGSATFP